MSRGFGWDYPPGVTGNERQIRGLDEGELFRECEEEATFKVVTQNMQIIVAELSRERKFINEADQKRLTELLIKSLLNNESEVIGQCNYSGIVEATFDKFGIYWTCPMCGTETEEEHDDRD